MRLVLAHKIIISINSQPTVISSPRGRDEGRGDVAYGDSYAGFKMQDYSYFLSYEGIRRGRGQAQKDLQQQAQRPIREQLDKEHVIELHNICPTEPAQPAEQPRQQ